MNTTSSIVIDKRRPKKDPTSQSIIYHIRLRVYSSVLKKSKRYKLGIALSEADYNKIMFPLQGKRLSNELNEIKIKLNKFGDRAKQVIDNIETFEHVAGIVNGYNHSVYLPNDIDLLIHAGDASLHGTEFEIKQFLEWFSSIKAKYKVLISGNHDFLFERQKHS